MVTEIRRQRRGETSPEMAMELQTAILEDCRSLTKHERAALLALGAGTDRREIARQLCISPHTLEHVIDAAKDKLGARTATPRLRDRVGHERRRLDELRVRRSAEFRPLC